MADTLLMFSMLAGSTGILLMLMMVGVARWHIRNESGSIGAIFVEGYFTALLWIVVFVGSVIVRRLTGFPEDATLLLLLIAAALAVMPWWSFARMVRWYLAE